MKLSEYLQPETEKIPTSMKLSEYLSVQEENKTWIDEAVNFLTPKAKAVASGAAEELSFGIFEAGEEQKEEFIPYAVGRVAGGVASLMSVGAVLKVAGLGVKAAQMGLVATGLSKLGQRFIPRAIMSGATFGTHTAINQTVEQVKSGGEDIVGAGVKVVKDAGLGVALGVVGGVANRGASAVAATGLGYTSSKLEGNDEPTNIITGVMWGLFEAIGSRGRDRKLREEAVRNIKDNLTKYAVNKGMQEGVAKQAAESFINTQAAKVGGLDKVLSSQENTLTYLEVLNRNIFLSNAKNAIKPDVKAITFDQVVMKATDVATKGQPPTTPATTTPPVTAQAVSPNAVVQGESVPVVEATSTLQTPTEPKTQPQDFATAEEYVASKGISVYRGMGEKGSKEFKFFENPGAYQQESVGVHFGTREQAEYIAKPKGGVVKDFVLDIKNPVRLDDKGSWSPSAINNQLFQKGILSREEYDKNVFSGGYDIREILKGKGYDGIVYKNVVEGEGDSYIVFDKSQILDKSQLISEWQEAQAKKTEVVKEVGDVVKTDVELPSETTTQSGEKILLSWNPKVKAQGEGFVIYSANQSKELVDYIKSLPENINKQNAIDVFSSVEKTLSRTLSTTEVKSVVREQTGQTQTSKELLNYLKEKYAEQIKAGELEADIERKLSEPLKASDVKGVVRRETGQIDESKVIKIKESQALKEVLRKQVEAASMAEKATREEIFDIQSNMIKVIDASDLDLADKAKFIKTIKNTNSPKDFKNMLPIIEERIKALEEKAEKKDLVKRINKVIERADSLAVDIEYQDAIREALKGFDLKNRSKEAIRNLKATEAYINRRLLSGEDVEIPADVIKKLNILSKKQLSDISNDELKELLSSIDNLERLGRLKRELKEKAYDRKKDIIKSEIIKDVSAINTTRAEVTPVGGTKNTMAEGYINFLNSLNKTRVGLTPIEGLADITGMRKVKDSLDSDFSKYLTYNDAVLKQWYDITKGFNEGNFDRIGVYAIAQQEGGLNKLVASGIGSDEVKNLTLTPEEQKAYDFVRDTFDSYYPEVKQYSKDVYNQDVGKIDNYVSFMANTEGMNDLQLYDKFSGKTEEAVGKLTKTVEQGFTKSRAEGAAYPIERNIDKIFRRHIDDVAYMLTMGKDIKMYYEIVNSPEMREKLGDLGAVAWLQYLDLMARKGGSEGAKRIALLDIVRRNMGAGVLGFRLSSALVQLSSFGDTLATLGFEWSFKGATTIATSKEWRDFIMDNFPEIKKSVGDDIAFREFSDNTLGKLQQAGMKPLQFMDGIMRSTAACGAYNKIAKERGVVVDLKNPDKDIILEATKLVRQSQGSSFFKDQPLSITTDFGLAGNKSLNKVILLFQSFMLGRWDNINRQVWRLGIQKKDYKKAIASLFWIATFGLALEEKLRRGGRAITNIGRDKKTIREEDPFLQDVALNALQTIPLAGSLASSIVYSSNPVPVINTFDNIIGGVGQTIKGKSTASKLRGALKAAGGLGALLGAPGVSQGTQIIGQRISDKKKKNSIRD